jgi:IS30 family transposase
MFKSSTNQEICYTHLSLAEREEIAIALEHDQSLRSIARSLARSPSSVCRELQRNNPPHNKVTYRGNRAHQRAADRSRRSHARERLANPRLKAYVESHLTRDGWTPACIAGRLPRDLPGLTTNHESIYLWIYHDRRDLIPYLVRDHKKRHTRPPGRKSGGSRIPNRVDISERPPQAGTRK